MSTYGFRLKFLLPEDSVIGHASKTLEIPFVRHSRASVKKTLLLKSVSDNNLERSHNLAIIGNGFASEDEASSYGIRVKNSLLYCATFLQMGVDCGKDKATSGVGKLIKDRAKEPGFLLLDDVHGLCTYPDDKPVRFVGIRGSIVTGRPAGRFINEFTKAFDLSLKFSDKVLLAFELYGASHFELSLRAERSNARHQPITNLKLNP